MASAVMIAAPISDNNKVQAGKVYQWKIINWLSS
jgi:hypothetical protein